MILKGLISIAVLSAACIGASRCGSDSPTAPAPVCTYTIAPATNAFAPDGGSGSLTVNAPGSCSWSATANASWLSIASGGSGAGSGTVAYAVSVNAGTDARSASLTVAGQTHTVSQQGKSPTVCTFDITPTRADVGLEETRGTFEVKAPGGCSWSATSDSSWLTITGGTPGSGDGTVAFLVTANPGADGRLGLIAVADKVFTVRQNANTAACQYSVAPVEFNPCMPASNVTAMVTAPAGCTWTAAPGAAWLSISSGASGGGSGAITITVTDNYDAPRDGVVMVRWPTPTAGQNIRIAQAGCTYAVSQGSFLFAGSGGTGTFNVIQQSVPNTCGGATQDRCIWSATADVPWISVPGSPHRGDDQVTFTVAANATGAPRVGRITVRDRVVVVNQAQ